MTSYHSKSDPICDFCKKNKYKISISTPVIINKIKFLIDMKCNNLEHIVEYNICYKCIYNINQMTNFYQKILNKMTSNENTSCFACDNEETIKITGPQLQVHFKQIDILKSFKPKESLKACPSCAYFMKIIKKYNNYLKDTIKDIEWENNLIHENNFNEVTKKFFIPGSSSVRSINLKDKLKKTETIISIINKKKQESSLSKNESKSLKFKKGKNTSNVNFSSKRLRKLFEKHDNNYVSNETDTKTNIERQNNTNSFSENTPLSKYKLKKFNSITDTDTDNKQSDEYNNSSEKTKKLDKNEGNESDSTESDDEISSVKIINANENDQKIEDDTTKEVTEKEGEEIAITLDIRSTTKEIPNDSNKETQESESVELDNIKNTTENVTEEVEKTTTNNKLNKNDTTEIKDDPNTENIIQLSVEEVNKIPVDLTCEEDQLNNQSINSKYKKVTFSEEFVIDDSNEETNVLSDTKDKNNSEEINDKKINGKNDQSMSEDNDIIFSLSDDNSENCSEMVENKTEETHDKPNEKINDQPDKSTSVNNDSKESLNDIVNTNNDLSLIEKTSTDVILTPRKSNKRIKKKPLIDLTPTRKSSRTSIGKGVKSQNKTELHTVISNIDDEEIIDLDDNETKGIIITLDGSSSNDQTIEVKENIVANTKLETPIIEKHVDTENLTLNQKSNKKEKDTHIALSETKPTTNRKRGSSIERAVSPNAKRNKTTSITNKEKIINEEEDIGNGTELETQIPSNDNSKAITLETRELMDDLLKDNTLDSSTIITDIMTNITNNSETESIPADNESFITSELTKELYKIHNENDIVMSLQHVRENVIDNSDKDIETSDDNKLKTVIESTSIMVNNNKKKNIILDEELCKMEKSKIFEEIDQELKEHKTIDEIENINSIEKLKIFAELDEELNKQCEKIITTTNETEQSVTTELLSTSTTLDKVNQNDSLDNDNIKLQRSTSDSLITDDELENEINLTSNEKPKEMSSLTTEDEEEEKDVHETSVVDNIYTLGKNIVDHIFKMNH